MVGPPVLNNPYVTEWRDYADKVLRISVAWNQTTRKVESVTLHRDPECLYTRVLVGLGPDGTPDTSTKTFEVGGITDITVNGNQAKARGFEFIDDFMDNFTAGFAQP